VWLPEAHPAAPSHVSALMSGVMVKMGLYGLLRFVTFLGPPPAWWGICLGVVGAATALVGIALAIHQCDVKRVLAYSTIENMGLVVLSLGVGMWGWAAGRTAISVLGFAAATIHIWNHAAMKGLMFFAAGSLLHATGSKDMDRMGGLMRRMPWTGSAMLLGAVAVAALPPLNGFVGKWLLFLGVANIGLERSDAWGAAALLATGLIAAVGGLAAVTYARLVGVALLGSPRSDAASRAHESPWAMRLPMLLLAALCIAAALFPWPLAACARRVADVVTRGEIADAAAWALVAERLSTLGATNAFLWVGGLLVGGLLARLFFRGGIARDATWGCGYVAPAPRMQYTGTSFRELLASRLLPRWLRPTDAVHRPVGLFPSSGSFSSTCPDPVTRRVYEPFFARWARRFAVLRILQQGKMHVYLTYIMAIVVIGLSWVAVRGWLAVP
jgi:formate hydrogenlyase subunit 3/multisubunit Na+/H+ antiporter MnhD subunit